jgi:hypothetical protein
LSEEIVCYRKSVSILKIEVQVVVLMRDCMW